jgi:LmbE family N-acetylglucosaminyl deacetylase
MHLYLSAHADDLPFSCGGAAAEYVLRGERVVVYTIMLGTPPAQALDTPLVQELHRRWTVGANVADVRAAEDKAGATALGIEWLRGDIPDCIYRLDIHNQPLYTHFEEAAAHSVFGFPDVMDSALHWATEENAQALVQHFGLTPADTLHAPLAIGDHVDHQIVCAMGKQISALPNAPRVMFYEDFPYYATDGARRSARALKRLGVPVLKRINHVSGAAWQKKIEAIRCHRSQLSTFWKSDAEIVLQLWRDWLTRGGEWEWEKQ